MKPLFYAIFEYYTGLGYFIRTTHRSRINVPLLSGSLFINFLVFSEENSIFVTIIEIWKKQPREVFLKNYENWKENTCVCFSPRVNISFQFSIYQVIFLNRKNLFSHCFPFNQPRPQSNLRVLKVDLINERQQETHGLQGK